MSQQTTGLYCIGIDLGTTNTTVAISRVDQNGITPPPDDIAVYQSGGKKEKIIPSILFVEKDGKELVGQPALEKKKNDIASSGKALRYVENAKRHMGDSSWTQEIDGKNYSAVDVAERILRCIRQAAKIRDVIDVADVYITTPANFGTDQINATKKAAQRAGFEKAQLRSEPMAAILSFLYDDQGRAERKQLDLSTKQRILVIDIGGGTCDICVEDVYESEDHEYIYEEKAVGRKNIGGADFDHVIAVALVEKYEDKYQLDQLSAADRARLDDLGQTFKELFTRSIMASIYEKYGEDERVAFESKDWRKVVYDAKPVQLSRRINGQDITFEMTGQEFCDAITPLIYGIEGFTISNRDEEKFAKNMKDLIQETLAVKQIDIESIDVLLLTGGMSLCFVLKAALYEMFQKKVVYPDTDTNPEAPLYAVSRGASLMNKYRTSSIGKTMPWSIMMETRTGELKKLISAGEQVPVSRTVEEIRETTSRNGVQIKLFEGMDEFDNQLKKLRSVYEIEFKPPKDLGRKFQIKYDIDETRQIKFTIIFLDDKSEDTIEAKYSEEQE